MVHFMSTLIISLIHLNVTDHVLECPIITAVGFFIKFLCYLLQVFSFLIINKFIFSSENCVIIYDGLYIYYIKIWPSNFHCFAVLYPVCCFDTSCKLHIKFAIPASFHRVM